jgi:hypothetical protein
MRTCGLRRTTEEKTLDMRKGRAQAKSAETDAHKNYEHDK